MNKCSRRCARVRADSWSSTPNRANLGGLCGGGAWEELTSREREVMALVAEGLTNAEIGERLFMSPATARTHVSRILTKLGARDRTQLVVMAYESGLVRPGWRG